MGAMEVGSCFLACLNNGLNYEKHAEKIFGDLTGPDPAPVVLP